MIKIAAVVKNGFIILMNIIAAVLIFISFLIPVYKYEWTLDPNLSKIMNPEAVLVVTIFSILSLGIASIAFALKKRSKVALCVFLVIVISTIYKLMNVALLFAG